MTQLAVGIDLEDFQMAVCIPSGERLAGKRGVREQSGSRQTQRQCRQQEGTPALLNPAMAHPNNVWGGGWIAKCDDGFEFGDFTEFSDCSARILEP
jgi:hypothetical protein